MEPYRLVYSPRVRELFVQLLAAADARGDGAVVRTAVIDMEHRLRVYPQFGEPYRDAAASPAVMWVGFVGPLTVRYALLEDLREVWVVQPVILSNESRLPPPAS